MSDSLHAGFVLPGVRDAVAASGRFDVPSMDALWRACCEIRAEASFELRPRRLPDEPPLLVASNILSRGLPTLPSLPAEELFARLFDRTRLEQDARARITSRAANSDPAFSALLGDALIAAAPPAAAQTAEPAAAGGGKSEAAVKANRERIARLQADAGGREALQLVLSPLAAARVAKAILAAALAKALDIGAAEWKLGVVERDVPGGALAVGELRRLLASLFALEGKGRSVPAISAWVLPAPAFAGSPLQQAEGVTILKDAASAPACDLLIDIGVLQNGGAAPAEIAVTATQRVTLRSAAPAAGETAPSTRRFHLAESRPWTGLYGKDGTAAAAVEDAVKVLCADCFRITRPSPAQLRLFDHVLQQRGFLAALPPAAGKTLAVHLATLLQPALGVMVTPLASLVDEQCEQLRDIGIDGVVCLHEGMGSDQRQAGREAFAERQGLLLLLTAELFRSEDIDALLAQLRGDKVPFHQCVIDEAHTLSEWSHDFRIGLQRAPAWFAARLGGAKQLPPVCRLLTSATSRDVITDLRQQLAEAGKGWALTDDDCIIENAPLRPWQHVACRHVPAEAHTAPEVLLQRQRQLPDILRRQQADLDGIVAATPPHEGEHEPAGDAAVPTVIYAPFASGILGVTNRYHPGESEESVEEVLQAAGIEPALFIGKEDGQTRVGRQLILDSAQQRRRFRDGQVPTLLATTAYGIGTHKADIRATVHLLPPPNVHRLLQECGRGGHDGNPSLHTVLFGGTPAGERSADLLPGFDPLPEAERLGGFVHLAELAGDPAREMQIAHDVLREITFAEDSNAGRVASMIEAEFGFDVRVSYWQRGLDERMYVHQGGNAIGYIDLVTQSVEADSGYPDRELGMSVLAFAHAFGLESAGSGPSLSSWVAATFPSDVDDGLARQLEDFDPGAEFTLRLGYENDREPLLTQIHQLLWRQAEIEIQRKLLSDVHATTWPAFRVALCRRAGNERLLDGLDEDIERKLQQLYNRIRLRGDTDRLLHHLGTLGLLLHHVAHPASRKYSLRIRSRADYEILEALERHLCLSMPLAQARAAMDGVDRFPGDTVLERCLYFLIDHSVLRQRRQHAAQGRTLHRLCVSGMEGNDAAFREGILRAAGARFALPWMLPALLERDADRLRLFSEAVTLLEGTHDGSLLENATQLVASCDLLDTTYPAEPGLEVLRSFAALLTAGDRPAKDTRERFAGAFGAAAGASGQEGESYRAAVAGIEPTLRRLLGDDETAFLLSLLEDEVKRVKSAPLPAPAPRKPAAVPQEAAARRRAADKGAEGKPAPSPSVDAARPVSGSGMPRDTEQRKASTGETGQRGEPGQKTRRREAEQRQAERREAERAEAERRRAERREAEQREAERREAERHEAERVEAERREAERREAERRRKAEREARKAAALKPDGGTESGIHDEIDRMLAEIDALAESAAPSPGSGNAAAYSVRFDSSSATPPGGEGKRGKAGDSADREFLQHLQWLQAFNNKFLKRYEP